ncbi:hypothetical protein JCM11641_007219 [Rhodosporidiobolus odoratus]
MTDTLSPPPPASSPPLPLSPRTKSVAFASSPLPSAADSSSTSTSSSSTSLEAASSSSVDPAPASPARPAPKRRRSSIKQGSVMPYRPAKELYTHSDPLIRRLRLRNGYGKSVNLEQEFREAQVVLFLFGASWRGSMSEPYEQVKSFAAAHPHQCKVVYVSVDQSEEAYQQNTQSRPWLAMDWNDGSNTNPSPSSPVSSTPPLEPYLLAGDPDLEEDLHSSDPKGEMYLRPYSRVYLAEKWSVLGVPNLVVYHPASRKVLSYHARFELLKEGKREATWEKWSKGEKVEFGAADFVFALRWSLSAAAIAAGYMLAVKQGYIADVVGEATAALSQTYFAR